LRFFGDEFVPGYWCLLILMLAQVGRAVAGPATHVLTLAGREKACLPVFAASLVALVAVNAGLVPFFGINGAAVAVLSVTLLWTVWMAAVARRVLEVNTVRV
jgi:O-antigen/teichoic acid export membrane protein